MTIEAIVDTVLAAAPEIIATTIVIRQLTTLDALADTSVLTAAPESITTTYLTTGLRRWMAMEARTDTQFSWHQPRALKSLA